MKYRLKIMQDNDGDGPREWDNLGTFAGWHRTYKIGDVQPSVDPLDYRAALPADEIVLPVYLMDHSGVAYSTEPFGCLWDSGQVGFIHCSPSNPEAEGMTPEAIEAVLTAEIATYSQWASGDVYGFQLEKWEPATCGDVSHGEWVDEDSCWGFYGTDWAENGIAEHLPDEAIPLLEDIEISY
jgi:hypothetical protein